MFAHGGADAGVVSQTFQKGERASWVREVREWAEGLEGILRVSLRKTRGAVHGCPYAAIGALGGAFGAEDGCFDRGAL